MLFFLKHTTYLEALNAGKNTITTNDIVHSIFGGYTFNCVKCQVCYGRLNKMDGSGEISDEDTSYEEFKKQATIMNEKLRKYPEIELTFSCIDDIICNKCKSKKNGFIVRHIDKLFCVKIIKKIPVISITIVAITLLLMTLFILQDKHFSKNTDTSVNNAEQQFLSDDTLAENLIATKCVEWDSNVYITECAIELLDRVAAEREWKQQKLEVAKHPQINIYEMSPILANEQLKIKMWREEFEKNRDLWCNAQVSFVAGSGIPLAITNCQLGFELRAINILNDIYYKTILENMYDSQGILNFEPTNTDIDALIKVNLTSRGCVWAGETECK